VGPWRREIPVGLQVRTDGVDVLAPLGLDQLEVRAQIDVIEYTQATGHRAP